MPIFQRAKTSVGDNQSFVVLMRVAQEDTAIRQQLVTILSRNAFHRKSILNSYVDDLRFKKAPPEFISAVACLLDDAVAERALDLLKPQKL